MSAPKVRPASVADAALIHRFILELAEYERLAHEVVSTPEDVERALEGGKVFAELVEIGGEPVGFSLSFYTFSTFVGRHGVYLEDLYVRPAARGAVASERRSAKAHGSPPAPPRRRRTPAPRTPARKSARPSAFARKSSN